MVGKLAADGVVRVAQQSCLAQLQKPCFVAAAVLYVVMPAFKVLMGVAWLQQ